MSDQGPGYLPGHGAHGGGGDDTSGNTHNKQEILTALLETIAEIYETQKDYDKAMKHYELAADFFKGEGSNSSAKSCMVKVAELSAKFNRYETAIGIYEQVGEVLVLLCIRSFIQVAHDALESPLLKYGAKDYYFRAAICHLAVDHVSARNAITRCGTSHGTMLVTYYYTQVY